MKSERELSDEHENEIARIFGGKRSKNSGAGTREKGDVVVRADNTLFECKRKGRPGHPSKSKAQILSHLEKVAVEAFEEGREPVLALRFYDPESLLANKSTGYVDLTVRLAEDDAQRTRVLGTWR
jgi:hypothetical protein